MPSVAIVLIKDATVDSRRVGENTFYSQRGFLLTGDGEALGIEVSLPRGMNGGYSTGQYHIAGASFDRDQYGRPCFGKRGLSLVPAPVTPAK
jgi:hypothetical protein